MIKALLFDLDGVIVSTDDCHYHAWKQLADREGIYFDREINERLRGVSRMESLAIILERAHKNFSEEEKKKMAAWKNERYVELLDSITPDDILPGVLEWLDYLEKRKIKTAIASSSRNAKIILKRLDMENAFDAVVDGNDIENSKPHPEVFLKAAENVGFAPAECLVVEDAEAGVAAAVAAGSPCLAVGSAANDTRASFSANTLADVSPAEIIGSNIL